MTSIFKNSFFILKNFNVTRLSPSHTKYLYSSLVNKKINFENVRFFSHEDQVAEPEEKTLTDIEKYLKKKRTILIDVREPSEVSLGTLPTAVNLPLKDVEDSLSLNKKYFKRIYKFEKPRLSDEIILFCKSGKRAQRAGKIFLNNNFENVSNFKGSWMKWVEHHPEDSLE